MPSSLRSPAAALIGSFLCILLSPIVLGFYSFTVFFESLSDELHWGRGILGFAITVGTMTIAITAPIAGRIADRGGARLILICANVALVGVVAAMAVLCTSLAGLYLAMALIGALAACYMVAIPRVIASWFDSRRGLALGVAMSGAGLGAALMAPLTAAVIKAAGWQQAYLVLAAIVLFVSLPAAVFLVHEAKHDAPLGQSPQATAQKPRVGLQLSLLAISFLLIGAGLHGVLIHFSPMLTDRGIDAQSAASFFAAASIAMFLGRLGCGYLLDRLPANWVGAFLMAGAAAGIVILYHVQSGPLLVLGAVLFGLGVSAELDLLSYIISRIYPLEHFSRFFAFAYSAFMIGTSVGPPLLGGLYDHFGNYTGGTIVAASLTAVSAFVLLAMRPTPTSHPPQKA